jgi:hypothetical protein
MMNPSGPRGTLFVPESVLELVVKMQISSLLSLSLICINLVFEELKTLAAALIELDR